MANLDAVQIKKGRVGANRRTNDRAVSGLIISSPVNPDLDFKKTVQVYGLEDARGYGITPEFDETNNVNVYRHVREFFRMAGEGTLLQVMLVKQETLLAAIAEDTAGDMAKQLLVDAKGKIRQLAIAVNPGTIEGTHVDGILPDVMTAIAQAQGLAQWAYDAFMPCQVFLEGYSLNGIGSVVPDLRDLPALAATKVSLVIGQDWEYAQTKTGIAQKYADVGTVLGVCSAADINQNIGDNEIFNLTDATKDAWVVPGLSNHQKNTDVHSQLQTFEDKGYVFGVEYPGLAGVRINNDHVCAPIVIDSDFNMNEHTVAYGRTMDDAVRQLRNVYLPKIKKTYPVNSAGKLVEGARAFLEAIGDDVFDTMSNASEISSGKTHVDPDSDLLVEKELNVSFDLQPTGTLGFLNGTINLKAKQ